MATRKKETKMSPALLSKPDSIISIQLRYKERAGKKLAFKKSKGLTLTGINLDDAYDLIVKAVKEWTP